MTKFCETLLSDCMHVPSILVISLWFLTFAFTNSFAEAEGCDTNLTGLNGTLISPTPPQRQNTASGYTCKWTIQLNETVEPRHVELRVSTFDFTGGMPSCAEGNYLEIYLGCHRFKSIGKFCGRTSLPVIYSPDHCLNIELRVSSHHYARAVFKAVFNQRPLSKAVSQSYTGCGKDHHLNTREGNIFSPHWPLPYPRYVDCVWRVTISSDFHIKLVFFDFDVRSTEECDKADFVEVKSGGFDLSHGKSLTNSKECGTKDPFVLTIEENSISIQFKSDMTTGNRGFMAGFVAYHVEKVTFRSEVLIMLGVIFLSLFVLAGKVILQKLINGKRLNRQLICQMLRRSVRLRRCCRRKNVLPLRESFFEPTVNSNYCPQCARACQYEYDMEAFTKPGREEERSQSKTAKKTVKFDFSTKNKQTSSSLITDAPEIGRI